MVRPGPLHDGAPGMQIVDRSNPARILGAVDAPDVAALLSVHAGSMDESERRDATAAIRAIRARRAWLRCSCHPEGPLLAPARLGETYYLRRLTLRAPHMPTCPFQTPPALSDGTESVSLRCRPSPQEFCRPLHRAGEPEHRRHDRTAHGPRPAPRLATELWRLMEFAGLNRADPLAPGVPPSSLTSQLAAIRKAARRIPVTRGVRLCEVLSTFPGDAEPHSPWQAKAMAAWQRFADGEQPQACMVGLARGVDGRNLATAVGQIHCASDVAFISAAARQSGPPFLFMLAGVIDPERDAITLVRAFAQPVFSANHLLPIDNEAERLLIGALLAFQRSAAARFPSLRISVEKPLFDMETRDGFVRPPFVLVIDNPTTRTVERLVARPAGNDVEGHDARLESIGRVLVVPDDILTGDAHMQAGWFVDAIYGAPLPFRFHCTIRSEGADHAALLP